MIPIYLINLRIIESIIESNCEMHELTGKKPDLHFLKTSFLIK